MLLATGKQLHTYIWEDFAITEQVIQRVYKLATKGKQPEMTKEYNIFYWSPGIEIMVQAYSEPENKEEEFHSNEVNDDITEYGEGEGKNEE